MAKLYIDIHTHQPPALSDEVITVWNNVLNKDQSSSYAPLSTAGLHPWYIKEEDPFKGFSMLETLLSENSILAVGECGLDKLVALPLSIQQEVFRKQIKLAQNYHKPLIIHCVRAFEEVQFFIQTEHFTGYTIFHGFNKNKILADQLIKKGFYLSFGASILSGKHDETLAAIPMGQLFLETDDVHMDIRQLYDYTARLKQITVNELTNKILKNYQLVFE